MFKLKKKGKEKKNVTYITIQTYTKTTRRGTIVCIVQE